MSEQDQLKQQFTPFHLSLANSCGEIANEFEIRIKITIQNEMEVASQWDQSPGIT